MATEEMTDYSPQHIASLLNGRVIVGVDPGDMTGTATFCSVGYTSDSLEGASFAAWLSQAFGFRQDRLIWVVEQFVSRPGSFAKIQYAPRVIGAIEYHAALYGQQVAFQQPGDIKTMIDPKDLKAAGWKWSTPHELDALRHALYWVLTRK